MNSPSATPDFSRPRVYYDGGCPLCRREIAHYRRLDRRHRLHWVDISQADNGLESTGPGRKAMLQRFHVLDSRGHWQTGAWGFAEMWAHLPYYRWLSRLLRILHLLPALDLLYGHFARWRAKRRCVDQCVS